MLLHDAIRDRRSLSQLSLPAPTGDQLECIFAAAGKAPDHRLLRPWRFLVVEGEALTKLGELFLSAVAGTDPERAQKDAERLRQMPLRAPMIIVAILARQEHPTVPDWEQWLSLGAATQNLLLALHAEGFAGMWRTGDLASHPAVCSGLGLGVLEQIGGFIYVGTAQAGKAAPAEPVGIWQRWPGSSAP